MEGRVAFVQRYVVVMLFVFITLVFGEVVCSQIALPPTMITDQQCNELLCFRRIHPVQVQTGSSFAVIDQLQAKADLEIAGMSDLVQSEAFTILVGQPTAPPFVNIAANQSFSNRYQVQAGNLPGAFTIQGAARGKVAGKPSEVVSLSSTIFVVGSAGSIPNVNLAIEQAIDTDHNNLIDDDEIRTAVGLWALGQPVPGTPGLLISDTEIMHLLALWDNKTPIIATQASALYGPLSPAHRPLLESVEAYDIGNERIRILAHGQGISSLEVELFDLAGAEILHLEAKGSALTFRPLASAGRPLANGVYLYVVRVKGIDGQTITSQVKKIALLR